MRSFQRVIAGTLAVPTVALLAGCGATGKSAETSATSASATTSIGRPVLEPRTNANERATPMGRLCWARREVSLRIVAAFESLAQPEAEALRALISELADKLESDTEGIDPRLVPFRDAFAADLENARSSLRSDATPLRSDLVNLFDFEGYPEAATYARVAEGECADP